MKKYISVIMIAFLLFIMSPTVVFGEASDNQSGSGSGTSGNLSDSNTKWPGYDGVDGNQIAGIRMSVVDQNGNLVPGTHTVDFVNKTPTDAKANSRGDRMKTGVIRNGISWTAWNSSGISTQNSPVKIKWDSNENLTVNGVTQNAYFNGLAKSDSLYNNYIVKTGYNRAMQVSYNKHYILVEPTTVVQISGKRYYGTATELAVLIGNDYKKTINTVPRKYLARSTCYSGSFMTPGKKNNNQTIQPGDQLYAFTAGSLTGGSCNALQKNAEITKASGNTVNGNGVGIYYAAAMLKEWCDINNPEHFHVVDGSDDQDYKPNDKTATCCEAMIQQYGQEYVERLYPICGACPVETSSKTFECGSEESVKLTDEDSFSCLFKGVSGRGASKYDYSARQAVRNKYKVGTIGTKYCEVYCTEDITGKFPGNYKGLVSPGGSFIWPSFNDDYKATLETTRTCKIRFRQQEWLNAFNKGNSSTKEKLVNALKECASENAINAYYDKYIESLDPTLTLSYNNGVTTIGPKTLKLDTKRSTYNKTCAGCAVNTSGITTSNATSMLNNIASGITNKVLTIKTNLRYVLPDGLYQYVDKKTGTALENYTPEDRVNSNGTVKDTKVLDSGNSKLVVDDKARAGQQYDVTIHYSGLSSVKNKFDKESGSYTCKYKPNNDPVRNQCDINEPKHFTSEDSGPNGENCCEWFANKYGTDSEEYLELVERGDCPACDPNDPTCPGNNSCVYPDDLATPDVAVKNKCCAMILVDKRYTLDERQEYYDQYCSGEPYCPQDCVNGVCHVSPMTQKFRNCVHNTGNYNKCEAASCPAGGRILIYRPISLIANEAFPGVEKENRIWSNNNWYYYSNWAYRGKSKKRDYYVDMYITNNRGVKQYDLYSKLEPMYVIKMDSKTIRTIRSYNTANSYDDFNLKCNKYGRQCRSDFVKQYATGCGVGDWYACEGISKARGD